MTLVIAHRGASSEAPEQSRAAYELALAQGADGVECDVRVTADGEVVCFHDATLDRTLGMPGSVVELTLEQLRALDPGLLTLGELLQLLRDARRPLVLAVELKHPNPVGTALEAAVLGVLDAAGWDRSTAQIDDVTVSLMSFNPLSVAALGIDPRLVMILTGIISIDDVADELPPGAAGEAAAAELERALAAGLQLLDGAVVGGAGPEVGFCRAQPERVRAWIAAGLTVRVWTADEPDDVDFLVGLGVQEITTNRPAAVLDQLGRAHAQ
ncbi:glycerophosphodiester phosphodiesterase [Schumannella luteola]